MGMRQLVIAFIGGGNMAEAMIAGLIRSGHAADHILVAEPQAVRREALAGQYGIITIEDNQGAATKADLLVAAVKPQQMVKALQEVVGHLKPEATVVSIAAGVTLASLQGWLGKDAHVVRVMPNTPALLGAGISGMFTLAGEEHRARAEYVMGGCGETIWVGSEPQLNAVTAVSGSGPAYFFLLAELMQATAVKLGLPEAVAAKLVAQTALGAGKMLAESGRNAEQLRHQVTSPGGTTQAALDVMYEKGMPEAVRGGVLAANRRSEELSK